MLSNVVAKLVFLNCGHVIRSRFRKSDLWHLRLELLFTVSLSAIVLRFAASLDRNQEGDEREEETLETT